MLVFSLLFLCKRAKVPSDIRGLSCYLRMSADSGWGNSLWLLRTWPEYPADMHIWSQAVVAEEQRSLVATRETAGEVDGGGGLSHTALLVRDGVDFHGDDVIPRCMSSRVYLHHDTAVSHSKTRKRMGSRGRFDVRTAAIVRVWPRDQARPTEPQERHHQVPADWDSSGNPGPALLAAGRNRR